MAAITSAVIVAAGSAYAANRAGKAAGDQQRGYNAATREQARQYDQSREDSQPWRDVGERALNQLAGLYGLGTPAEDTRPIDPNTGQRIGIPPPSGGGRDYSAFYDSPDYQFARDEGLRGIERSAAARGGLASGNTLAALTRYSSGLATQNFNNYAGHLSSLAGNGQAQVQNDAALGANYANNVGQNAIGAANARASGVANQANIYGNAANQLAGLAGYYGNQQPRPYGGTGYGMGGSPSTPGYGGPLMNQGGPRYA